MGPEVTLTMYSLAGEQLCQHSVRDVVGPSSALLQLTSTLQESGTTTAGSKSRLSFMSWFMQKVLPDTPTIHIQVSSTRTEEGKVSEYDFHAVKMTSSGKSLKEVRNRLSSWGLPTQLGGNISTLRRFL